MTFCSRRPNHIREAENLHPTPTPAPTLREPPKQPKRSQNASPRPPKKTQTRPRRDSTYACNRKAFRERSGSPQNGQKDPKTPAPGPQKKPKPGRGATQRSPAVPTPTQRFPAVRERSGSPQALKGLRSRQPVKLPMRAVVLNKICCHRAGACFFFVQLASTRWRERWCR